MGEGGALVSDEGRTKLIEGTATVLAPEGGGKIDLGLESAAGGYEPANPIVAIHIPTSANEGIAVGEEGVEISQAGAQSEPTGRLVEELNVFYPEVHTDTDLLVSPTATGVELFDQLRSEDSPEELRFHLQLPAGAQLGSSGNAAEVIAADGSKLASVLPPTAVDAQGISVPVQLQWNRLGRITYISLAFVAFTAFAVASGCGSATGSDAGESPKVLSASHAKHLLLQLPYKYKWHDVELPEGASGALAGTAIGKHHTVVHFGISLGTEPDAVPVPPAGLLTPYYYYGGGFVLNDDLEVPGKGETVHPGKQFHTAVQWYEANLMEVEMTQKICEATTGKVCPV